MSQLAQTIAGTRDWNAVLRKADEDHPRTEEEMRERYADWTERARSWPRPAWSRCPKARSAWSTRHPSSSGR